MQTSRQIALRIRDEEPVDEGIEILINGIQY